MAKERSKKSKRVGSDLRSFTLNPLQHAVEGRLGETTLNTGGFVIGESSGQPLRTIVEGVSEGLVDTLDGITTSHEDLGRLDSSGGQGEYRTCTFKGRGAGARVGSDEDGFGRHDESSGVSRYITYSKFIEGST